MTYCVITNADVVMIFLVVLITTAIGAVMGYALGVGKGNEQAYRQGYLACLDEWEANDEFKS